MKKLMFIAIILTFISCNKEDDQVEPVEPNPYTRLTLKLNGKEISGFNMIVEKSNRIIWLYFPDQSRLEIYQKSIIEGATLTTKEGTVRFMFHTNQNEEYRINDSSGQGQMKILRYRTIYTKPISNPSSVGHTKVNYIEIKCSFSFQYEDNLGKLNQAEGTIDAVTYRLI